MFEDLLDFARPYTTAIVVAIVLGWLLVPSVTAWVFKVQRDRARAELALQDAEARSLQQRLLVAESEASRYAREFREFQAWVQAHPAPKDPEALRQWLLDAGKR